MESLFINNLHFNLLIFRKSTTTWIDFSSFKSQKNEAVTKSEGTVSISSDWHFNLKYHSLPPFTIAGYGSMQFLFDKVVDDV